MFNLGHNPPEIVDVLKDALGRSWPNLVQMDAPPLSGVLAEELSRRDPTGRLERVYFGSSGAEAIETAIKFARCATRRSRLLSFEGGFHGLTMGALSLSGEGGVRELPQAAWDEIQKLCRRHGTLLIADEIQCGMDYAPVEKQFLYAVSLHRSAQFASDQGLDEQRGRDLMDRLTLLEAFLDGGLTLVRLEDLSRGQLFVVGQQRIHPVAFAVIAVVGPGVLV